MKNCLRKNEKLQKKQKILYKFQENDKIFKKYEKFTENRKNTSRKFEK